MKKIFCSQIIFILFLTLGVNSQALKNPNNADLLVWSGRYTYTYTEGRTQGGWVPVIEYVIDVTKEGESLVAHVTADGYQSNENFICTAKISGNRLNLYFLKDMRDAESYDGVNNMRRGQLVGSLNKSTVRGRIRYDYRDGALILRGIMKTPLYFKKLR